MIMIFFGPPGAGKGTQAAIIAKKFNIPHLSTGIILRNKLIENDSLSKKLKNIIESGNLVSDDILNKIVKNNLNKPECLNGFILDGYPRTMNQAVFLNKTLIKKKLILSNIIELSLDEKNIIKRIKSRSNIEKRKDDKSEIIKIRIEKYLKETKPLLNYYYTLFPSDYHVVNGNQEIKKIQQDIYKIVQKSPITDKI